MNVSMKAQSNITGVSVHGRTYSVDKDRITKVMQEDVEELINHGFSIVDDNRVQRSESQEDVKKHAEELARQNQEDLVAKQNAEALAKAKQEEANKSRR